MIHYLLTGIVTCSFLVFPGCDANNTDPDPDSSGSEPTFLYKIVDTGVNTYYNDHEVIAKPVVGDPFYGQDAQYTGFQPSYTDNGDGTVTDNITGLTWQKDMGEKMSWDEASIAVIKMDLGGYRDWRIPDIKELYSLIRFTGRNARDTLTSIKFINEAFFVQPWGDPDEGVRYIDAQTWSSTVYTGTTMHGDETIFGVNFVDGRIKGYPKYKPMDGSPNKLYFRMVRGGQTYGKNDFVDNKDGTVSDLATGLMWQQADDGSARDWQEALAYAENLELGGYDNWRLPNAKELQSIVDYSRSPEATGSPAIDPVFSCSRIEDPEGNPVHYPYYWTGTTHLDGIDPESAAVYIAFGKALGYMNNELLDVHGAGAQRSDPKSGDPADYPDSWGPQGDVRYVYNYVRCVRDIQ